MQVISSQGGNAEAVDRRVTWIGGKRSQDKADDGRAFR